MNKETNNLSSSSSVNAPGEKLTTAVKSAKPRVRKAEVEDFDKVFPLLSKLNSSRLKKSDWSQLFYNQWHISQFSPGIILQVGNDIVGYLGTIYSQQMVKGEVQTFCNLTTWIVEDEYRNHSILMLIKLLKDKQIIFTSYSSNDVVYYVYKKLGFQDGNNRKRMVYPFPSFASKHYQMLVEEDEICGQLNSTEQKIFNDHCRFNNINVLIKFKDEHCLLMGTKRNKKLKIYYASNKLFLQKHLSAFRNKLISFYQVNKLQIDECLLDNVRIILSRSVERGNPYQFKNVPDNGSWPMPLYSELFLLNM